VFVPGFPPAIAPELSDPAQWQRFAVLRDAVERGELEAAWVRAVFDELESVLWDEAKQAYAMSERGPIEAFVARAFAPVDDALSKFGV
jgi:hypothetical protein